MLFSADEIIQHDGSCPDAATQRALEGNLAQERGAHLQLVYGVGVLVLDPLQWCRAAAALYPLHCDAVSYTHLTLPTILRV